jgi:hypothetical protein
MNVMIIFYFLMTVMQFLFQHLLFRLVFLHLGTLFSLTRIVVLSATRS